MTTAPELKDMLEKLEDFVKLKNSESKSNNPSVRKLLRFTSYVANFSTTRVGCMVSFLKEVS